MTGFLGFSTVFNVLFPEVLVGIEGVNYVQSILPPKIRGWKTCGAFCAGMF